MSDHTVPTLKAVDPVPDDKHRARALMRASQAMQAAYPVEETPDRSDIVTAQAAAALTHAIIEAVDVLDRQADATAELGDRLDNLIGEVRALRAERDLAA